MATWLRRFCWERGSLLYLPSLNLQRQMWRFIKKSKFAISLHKSKNSFTLTLDKTLRFLFVGVLIITKTEKTIKNIDKKKKQGKRKIGEYHKQPFPPVSGPAASSTPSKKTETYYAFESCVRRERYFIRGSLRYLGSSCLVFSLMNGVNMFLFYIN